VFRGLLTSFVGHGLVLAWAFLSIQRTPQLPETVTIEATIVTPSELTRLKQGSPDSKELEAKAKEEPTPEVSKKEAEKPKPVTAPPPPAPEPEPEKVEEAKPKEDAIADKLAALPPPEPGPTPEEKKMLAEKLEQERKAEENRKKAEQKKKAEEKRKKEEAKKKAEALKKKLAEAKRKAEEAKKKKQFDADRIAALIDKSPDKRGAPRTALAPTKPTDYTGPTAGERRGTDTVLSAREADLLKGQLSGQLRRCWHLPGGGGGIETTVVTLKWRLKPDGSLDGLPQVVRPQSGPVFQIAAEAAVRAVTRCAPFDLPPEKYGVWKTVEWNFDPREMM
jgi:colicin import membrane protein